MMNVDRYRHADRTYVNIFAAVCFLVHRIPGAHAPGYIYAAASRLSALHLASGIWNLDSGRVGAHLRSSA